MWDSYCWTRWMDEENVGVARGTRPGRLDATVGLSPGSLEDIQEISNRNPASCSKGRLLTVDRGVAPARSFKLRVAILEGAGRRRLNRRGGQGRGRSQPWLEPQ